MGGPGGLAAFDGTNWTIYNTSNSGLPDNHVQSIAIDENGTKWIGTFGEDWLFTMKMAFLFMLKENVLANSRVNIFPNPTNNKV